VSHLNIVMARLNRAIFRQRDAMWVSFNRHTGLDPVSIEGGERSSTGHRQMDPGSKPGVTIFSVLAEMARSSQAMTVGKELGERSPSGELAVALPRSR
jgi:hypothetical protein